MDHAVLAAYGWDSIDTTCAFLLDHDDEDDSGRRRKPWRYRWPDEVRDEVLGRLVELNSERAAAEQRAGPANTGTAPRRAARTRPAGQTERLI